MSSHQSGSSVEYEAVSQDYLDKRQFKQGAAGRVLLATLGVSCVISGDFAGWNFGLEQGGFGGLLIATLVMGLVYLCMVLSLAEKSASLPTAGGGYSFARRALGPWGRYLTGTAILLEYALAALSIVVFISSFFVSLGAALWSALFYGLMIAYFGLYSCHHLVASAPEEEFEAIAAAEQELS